MTFEDALSTLFCLHSVSQVNEFYEWLYTGDRTRGWGLSLLLFFSSVVSFYRSSENVRGVV